MPRIEGDYCFMEYFLTYRVYTIWAVFNDNGVLYYK